MAQIQSQTSVTDEDEDLEQLRLAALKSLKKPLGTYSEKIPQQRPFYSGKNGLNRNRGSYHGRPHRNGQFNHRTRNSNLIAVPLISSDATEEVNNTSKLVLPQDRYCKMGLVQDEKTDEPNSKFNRYNDKSDSESESEEETCTKKLERANSLEALMQELENEIEGRSNNAEEKEKAKVKVKKQKKKIEEVQENKQKKVEEKPVVLETKEECNQVAKFEKTVDVVPEPYVSQYYQPPVIPLYNPPVPVIMHYEPPRYDRIPSPLTLDADILSTTVAAPLSPRSAAFVLQNREIIERRKRRSYSRSPSTPRYSNRRSRTKSRSPKSRTATPPRRRGTPEKKGSIHERLGTRMEKLEQSPVKRKRSRSKTPPPQPQKTPDKKLDPVLEARKKKFESNELKIKEGVIRLKPNSEQKSEVDGDNNNDDDDDDEMVDEEEVEEEEEEETDDVIDANIGDLFSDEETDNENEGRFKDNVNKETEKTVTVIPFSRIKNKENRNEKKEQRPASRKKQQISRLMLRTDKQKITPPVSTLPEKKIEIKIRNPTKYEEKKEQKEKVRKVEIGPRIQEDSDNNIEINEDEDDELVELNEGDLRAQLSRKRAERQSKISVGDGVASRLLQSALESAVFKKVRKIKNAAQRDGKLPIHSRLGVPVEVTKKKRKRNKNRGGGGLDQV